MVEPLTGPVGGVFLREEIFCCAGSLGGVVSRRRGGERGTDFMI